MNTPASPETTAKKSSRLAWLLALVPIGFFIFAFAQAPLYDRLCKFLGIRSSDRVYTDAPLRVASRSVQLEFLSTVMPDLPWDIKPLDLTLKIQPGQTYRTSYRATNTSGRFTVAQAVPSFSPAPTAEFVNKIQCFCFNNQKLAPGESKDMSVVFTVSPDLPDKYSTISLSYTFYNITDAVAEESKGSKKPS